MATLQGVFAAAVTPRRLGVQDINLGVMWDLIDFLVSHKVDGLVLLGTTGEFVHYSNSERMRMMGLAPKRSRVPVLFNVSHSTLDGAVELAQAAAASGAAGVLVMPPYFFRYDPVSLDCFFREFVREAEIDIPILLYNIPNFSNPVPAEVADGLLRNKLYAGVKDSSGDVASLERFAGMRREYGSCVLVGSDGIFANAMRQQMADGVVSGVASAVPELLVALNRALAGDRQEVITRLEARLDQFIAWVDRMPIPVVIKEAAATRGLKLGPHAIPPRLELERTIGEFREWFKGWLPDVQSECKHA
ncbi:MAG TPA: dihydrodipicolinate synthase family protein [Bryobacteraceae bacterium]|nr:dihydrodipicolinate synthase family protein [Bryobacteraceae bacterium]